MQPGERRLEVGYPIRALLRGERGQLRERPGTGTPGQGEIESGGEGATLAANHHHPYVTGQLARWQTAAGFRDFNTRSDWLYELGFDAHGSTADPQLVDRDGLDNMLGFSKTPTGPATILDNTTNTGGLIPGRVDSASREIAMMRDQQTAMQLRLDMKRKTLQAQFTAMETALSSLKNQSTWLAGQINSLPTYG